PSPPPPPPAPTIASPPPTPRIGFQSKSDSGASAGDELAPGEYIRKFPSDSAAIGSLAGTIVSEPIAPRFSSDSAHWSAPHRVKNPSSTTLRPSLSPSTTRS